MRRWATRCQAILALVACTGDTGRATAPPTTPPAPTPFVPGQSYFGRNNYVEYVAGNSAVIFSAPHGGSERPTGLPTRGCGTNVRDTNTEELARTISVAFHARFGRYPHVVINRLHRDRLDANRDSVEASCGNPGAGAAWREFHDFIVRAKETVAAQQGRGFLVDLHGHGHAIQRVELGYLLSGAILDRSDSALNASPEVGETSSIRTIVRATGAPPLATLLRGPASLGTLLALGGIPAVPSRNDPGPMGADYFTGGYITDRHGCRGGGGICAVQVEAHFTGVRDTEANRSSFATLLVASIGSFLRTNWGLDVGS